jgi:8-oxo-dGTP diphosphatase
MEKLNLKNAEIEKKTHLEYFNIAVSVDCVIFCYEQKQLKVLLMKSDFEEFKNLLSLVGDLVQPQEDIDDAPYRVLWERGGLKNVFMEQVQTFGAVDRHPSGRVITVAYYSLVDARNHKLPSSELEFHWHPVNTIKQLAFDHKLILDSCLQRLREKVLEHPVIFNLLPEKFSLRELQDLYEAILGFQLDRRNFRKRITLKNWLVDLNQMEEDVPHRPGKLYKLRTHLKSHGRALKVKPQKLAV